MSQTPGVQDFFEDTRERVQSGLVRLNMDSVQQKSPILALRCSVFRKKIHGGGGGCWAKAEFSWRHVRVIVLPIGCWGNNIFHEKTCPL